MRKKEGACLIQSDLFCTAYKLFKICFPSTWKVEKPI